MKKLKKLSLTKEVITKLQNDEMKSLNGGIGNSQWLCGTYFNTGNCKTSNSCGRMPYTDATVVIYCG
jgi:natural product precursor